MHLYAVVIIKKVLGVWTGWQALEAHHHTLAACKAAAAWYVAHAHVIATCVQVR